MWLADDQSNDPSKDGLYASELALTIHIALGYLKGVCVCVRVCVYLCICVCVGSKKEFSGFLRSKISFAVTSDTSSRVVI